MKLNRIVLTLCAAAAMIPVSAEVKLDPGSASRLRAKRLGVEMTDENGKPLKPAQIRAAADRKMKKAAAAAAVHQAFVTLNPGFDATELEEAGVTVNSVRGTMVLAEIPDSLIEAVQAMASVKEISLSRPVQTKLDNARKASGIDKIHSGLDIDRAYTGKGVVAGIVDGGFDPNHINFLDDEGNPRIKQMNIFRTTTSGQVVENFYTAENLWSVGTDDMSNFHGSHTLGIMAGGYRGNVTAAEVNLDPSGEPNAQNPVVKVEKPNPYYGVATESEIVAVAGATNDYFMALGIDRILEYAWNHPDGQRPVAVNMSLGSNLGPHDGTSSICRFMDQVCEMGQDKVIFCVSAGNEGDMDLAAHFTLPSANETQGTFFRPLYPTQVEGMPNLRYGQTYLCSESNEPFEVQMVVYNQSRKRIAWRGAVPAQPEGSEGMSKYWVSSTDYAAGSTDVVDALLGGFIEGYVGINAMYNPDSGNYYAVLDYFCFDNVNGSNANGNYILGFVISGKEGTRVNAYTDGYYCLFDGYGYDGFIDGTPDGSISDVATGYNYISVGSYNTRNLWAAFDGYPYIGEVFTLDDISFFSSYGKMLDGRELPVVCAPGAVIMSSSNEYYLKAMSDMGQDEDAQATRVATAPNNMITPKRTVDYSWQYSTGTSMSSPLVAGTMALWLEADPDLTYKDAIDIIRKTATKDAQVNGAKTPTQWGAGKFNAYEGIKEVIRRRNDAGVDNVVADAVQVLSVSADGYRTFRATIDGSTPFTATLHSATGALAGRYASVDGEVTVDASALSAGVYILTVENRPQLSRRVLVK